MANRFCNLDGNKKIKDDFQNITIGFDKVEIEMDALNSNINAIDNRVDEIITTPVEGVSAAEIIDARKGEVSLGAKITKIDNNITTVANALTSHEAESALDDVHGLGYSGAHIRITTSKSIPSEDVYTTVPFDTADFQIKGIFWNSNNPTRLVIPSGVSRVRLKASFYFGAGEGRISARLRKNGGGIPFMDCMLITQKSAGIPCSNILTSPVVSVVPGDFFEFQVSQTTGSAISLSIYNNNTWFNIEVIE